MNSITYGIGNRQIDYPDMKNPEQSQAVNDRMLTIEEYERLAIRMICKFAPGSWKKHLLSSDEAMHFITYNLMMGDWCFDPAKSQLKTYRGYRGKRAIRDYLNKLRDTKVVSNYFDGPNFNNIDNLNFTYQQDILSEEYRENIKETKAEIEKYLKCLTPNQRKCIVQFYFDNMAVANIAEIEGVRKQAVAGTLHRAIENIRNTHGIHIQS